MREIVTEELLKKIENRFLLSIVAARRARQIMDGAVPLVEIIPGDNELALALSEILADKIRSEITLVEETKEPGDEGLQIIENIKKAKKKE